MKLALFDDNRLGVVTTSADGDSIVDVTAALPWPHDPDPLTAGWWGALCRDFGDLLSAVAAASEGRPRPVSEVALCAPVLGPTKVIAAASNYGEHVAEMHGVQERTLGRVEAWMMDFDVFLKAPSSIVGPGPRSCCRQTWWPLGTRCTTSLSW